MAENTHITNLFDGAKERKRLPAIEVTCDECGIKFRKSRKKIKEKKFCSSKCQHDSGNTVFECDNCGKRCRRVKSAMRTLNYCSPQCKDSRNRVIVGCSWPGCNAQMEASPSTAGGETVYKTDLRKNGNYSRFPLCKFHRSLAEKAIPNFRFNGRLKWIKNIETDMGTRSTNSKISRLIIFHKTDGKCAHCSIKLHFDEKKKWNIDHTIPVYKGGLTNFINLQLLCVSCHSEKTRVEKSEVGKRGYKNRVHRGHTHAEKDERIRSLISQIEKLEFKNIRLEAENARYQDIIGRTAFSS